MPAGMLFTKRNENRAWSQFSWNGDYMETDQYINAKININIILS